MVGLNKIEKMLMISQQRGGILDDVEEEAVVLRKVFAQVHRGEGEEVPSELE